MELEDTFRDLLNSFFIILMSNYGNGKSLASTYLSILQSIEQNRKIMLSNMPIFNLSSYNIEFIPLISTKQLTENINNIQIDMDEMQKIANSRDSQSPRNSFVTEFSTDVRKFNQSICGTTQFGNTIDVRLYDNSTTIIIPEFKYKLGNNQKRLNFEMFLNIYFKDLNEIKILPCDLEIITQFYNTNFKPFKIIVNHDEYIEKLEQTRNKKYVDDYINKCNKKINRIEKIFNLEMSNKM